MFLSVKQTKNVGQEHWKKGQERKAEIEEWKVNSARLMPPMLICKQISAEVCNLSGPEGLKGIDSQVTASCWESNFITPISREEDKI